MSVQCMYERFSTTLFTHYDKSLIDDDMMGSSALTLHVSTIHQPAM